MKNMNDIENKVFLDTGLTNGSTSRASVPPMSVDTGRKNRLEMSMPYCLIHKIELKPSMLETKHCWEKGCSHLVFVKEVWTFPRNNEGNDGHEETTAVRMI